MNTDENVPRHSAGIYKSDKVCPECHIPEQWEHFQERQAGYGWKHDFIFSCEHFGTRSKESLCRFCGKKNTPIRQVPLPLPISDCYCDECAEKCRALYQPVHDSATRQGL